MSHEAIPFDIVTRDAYKRVIKQMHASDRPVEGFEVSVMEIYNDRKEYIASAFYAKGAPPVYRVRRSCLQNLNQP